MKEFKLISMVDFVLEQMKENKTYVKKILWRIEDYAKYSTVLFCEIWCLITSISNCALCTNKTFSLAFWNSSFSFSHLIHSESAIKQIGL